MKIKIVETREVIYEPDMKHYPDGDHSPEGVIRVEQENHSAYQSEYMDMHDAPAVITFEVIEE